MKKQAPILATSGGCLEAKLYKLELAGVRKIKRILSVTWLSQDLVRNA